MVNINKLKGKIIENGLTVETLADKIGIDRSTLYRRISSEGGDFSIKEADKIVSILGLTCEDANAIFFNQFVA